MMQWHLVLKAFWLISRVSSTRNVGEEGVVRCRGLSGGGYACMCAGRRNRNAVLIHALRGL